MKESIGLTEIAKLANVSLGTVDRAIHNRGRVSEATRNRILAIADRFGYKPNLAARALSTRPGSYLVGVCIPREIHYYFNELRDGILEEAKHFEHLGLQLQYLPIERLGADETAAMAAMIESEPRAIIITPGNPEELTPVINDAEERNIRVICLDTDAPSSRRTAVVSADDAASGNLAAELLGRFVPAGSHVAVVTGTLETEGHRKRTMSFSDLFAKVCPGGRVVEIVEDHDREEEAFQKCYHLLRDKTTIAGLYVTTANCLPVCRAVTALNLSHKITLLASDLFPEMKPYFDMGVIAGSIYARPFSQGRMAVRLIAELLLYGHQVRSEQYVAPQVVMRSTVHLFREMRHPARKSDSVEHVD